MKYISLIVWLFLSISAFAADSIPPLAKAGVCTHYLRYSSNTNIKQVLTIIGARYVLDEFSWQRAEQVKGTFQMDSRMSKYIDTLNALNIRPIMMLGYSNTNYTHNKNDKTGPNNPELIKAFADYVSFMVATLKGKVYAWEIWNEPDLGCWHPTPDSKEYNLLVKYVAPIIRQIDPQALIVAGAFGHPDWVFLDKLKEEGSLEDIDVISFHWYTHPNPPDQG